MMLTDAEVMEDLRRAVRCHDNSVPGSQLRQHLAVQIVGIAKIIAKRAPKSEPDDRVCKAASTRPPDDAEWFHMGHYLACPTCGRKVGMHGGFISRHFRPEAMA